jgi:tetratricopeptide (TPR) repeat protein
LSSSVKVTWEIRLGKIGETEIERRLACFSIPQRYEIDVGIDFYCELLKDGSPSTPFYVQAKGTEHFDNKWGQSIKKPTIIYWLQQAFPVFLIVYDDNIDNCYWMSIEDLRYTLIEKMSKTRAETIYIKMDRSHILEKGKGKNDEFIGKIKDDLASIELFRGRPQFKGEGYVKAIPSPPRSSLELLRIRINIRMYLYSLVLHYMKTNDLETLYTLCDFLTKFDKSHYNHFVWFGTINRLLGNNEQARRSFEEALRICERDKTWPRESMEKIITQIKREIESCM